MAMVECDERPDALLAVTGEQLGTYILSECIGRGGMGAVFRARHATLGREVAIKILSPDRSGDPQAVERFFAEARAVNATRNEHLVQITDFIEDDPRFKYCVMELLEGETLLERLTREPHLEWPLAVDIARQVLSALVDAHAAQIVHRDIKPDNIFLCRPREGSEFPFVKILDFGVAKVGRDRRRLSTTAAGAIIGTPEYMSPEQVSGAVADERSDLYSVAVTLYEMLTGQRPFHGDDFGQLVVAHLTLSPKRPSEIAPQPIPFALEQIVLRGLEKDAESRFQTAEDMLLALSELPQSGPFQAAPVSKKSRWGLWMAGLVAAAVAAAGIYFGPLAAQQDTPAPPAPVVAAPEPEPELVPIAPEPKPVETVTLALRSTPAGAEVRWAGEDERLGLTPLEKTITAAPGKRTLVFSRTGYTSRRLNISTDQSATVEIALVAKRARRSKGRTRPTEPAPPPVIEKLPEKPAPVVESPPPPAPPEPPPLVEVKPERPDKKKKKKKPSPTDTGTLNPFDRSP